MARTKVEKIPVLRDWSAVDAALQEMRECRFSLTELDVEQKRRIDDLKGQYKERETALQNRYKRLAAEVEEYVSAHRAELTGKSRRLKFGVVGYRLSSSLVTNLGEADTIALLEGMGHTELIKVTNKLDRAALMRQPAELLDRVDAWIKTRDTFGIDIDDPEPEA